MTDTSSAPVLVPRLTYFDTPGRAEPIRLAFHLAGIKFEDRRLTGEQWMAMMSTAPATGLPFLEMGTTIMTQSQAILRYVGKLAGLYPDDSILAAKVDELLGIMEDIAQEIIPSMFIEGPEKTAMRKVLAEESLPRWFERLESRLRKNGGNFFVGNSLTIADLQIFCMCSWIVGGSLDDIPKTLLDHHAALKAFVGRLGSTPKIKEWFQAHQNPKPKLTYFDLPGRAAATRLCFHLGGIEFDDVRIQLQDWPKLQPTTPFHSLPLLEIGDEVLTQSHAIARYAAKKAKLYPVDPLAAAKVDEILGYAEDIGKEAQKLYAATPETMSDLRANVEKEILYYVGSLEKKLTEEFFLGSFMTLADVQFFLQALWLSGGDGSNPFLGLGFSALYKDAPKLRGLMERMGQHAKIKEWLQSQMK